MVLGETESRRRCEILRFERIRGLYAAMHFRILMAAVAAPLCVGAASGQDNAAANDVYGRMADAYASRDSTALATVFHPRMVTASSSVEQSPVIGGPTMSAIVAAGLDRLRESGRNAQLSFRITHREWVDGMAIDIGVLRLMLTGGGREDRIVYSRFLSTLAQRPDGYWSFLTDAPSTATERDWHDAEPAPGARFDR